MSARAFCPTAPNGLARAPLVLCSLYRVTLLLLTFFESGRWTRYHSSSSEQPRVKLRQRRADSPL